MKMKLHEKIIVFFFLFAFFLFTSMCIYAGTPTYTSDYVAIEATGGYMYFDPDTGKIVGCDTSVTSAVIPETIDGVTVTAIGTSAFSCCKLLETLSMPDTIIEIGGAAFTYCQALQTIELPDNLIKIDYDAFNHCTSLKSIDIPDGVESIPQYCFYKCESLESVELPANLQAINSEAFHYCDALTSITIPKTVTSFVSCNGGPFELCSSLQDIYFEDGTTEIGTSACQGIGEDVEVHIPDTVTKICVAAFSCAHITQFTIPDTVTTIENLAFYCSDIESLTIPGTVTSTGLSICEGCENLKSIEFDNEITEIPNQTCMGCTSLAEVVLGDEVTCIGSNAFQDCADLVSINLPDTLKTIDRYAFEGCSSLASIALPEGLEKINGAGFGDCDSLEEVTIPEGLQTCGYLSFGGFCDCDNLISYTFEGERTALPKYMFAGAVINFELTLPSTLEKISYYDFYAAQFGENGKLIIPDTITFIGGSAFANSDLTEIKIPSGVVEIDSFAFSDCTSLSKVELNEGLVEIGAGAFKGCTNLTEITFPDSLKYICHCAFSDTKLSKVELPEGIVAAGDEQSSAFSSISGFTYEDIILDEDITVIPEGLYGNMSGMDGYEIPSNITEIGDAAFSGSDIESIEIPDNIISIGSCVFRFCDDLVDVEFGESLAYLGSYAFANCGSLENIKIVMKNGTIGEDVLFDCDELTMVEMDGAESIPASAFWASQKLATLIVGEGTTSIEKGAFTYCKNLETVKLPASMVSIYNADTKVIFPCSPTIYAPAGSYAETYANLYSLPFIDNDIENGTCIGLETKYTYTGKAIEPSFVVNDSNGNELEEGTDYTVSYEDNTSVGIATITITGIGNYSGSQEFHYIIVPKAPSEAYTRLSVASGGYDDVCFTWSKSTGASGYRVYYKKSTASSYTYYKSTTGTSVVVRDLTDGTKYIFKVVPYYKASDGTKYSALESKTSSIYTLKKISTPTVKKYSSSKVKVSWTNISGESGHQISRSTSKTRTNIVCPYSTTSGTSKVISAVKGKTYYYKVRAYKVVVVNETPRRVYGPWSTVKAYKLI